MPSLTSANIQNFCIAFNGTTRIASGNLREVALCCKELLDRDHRAQVLIFDDATGEVIDLNFHNLPEQVALAEDADTKGPGRPRLGVVSREVTLLPRHWEWLASQPGGASVTLRKLVENTMKTGRGQDNLRRAQEAAYRFTSAMAGNEPGFEEAVRALFGGQRQRFKSLIERWPPDVRQHVAKLAERVFCLSDEDNRQAGVHER